MVKVKKLEKPEFIEYKVKYNKEFLEEMKAKIDKKDRRWDPYKKVWKIRKSASKVMEELIKKYFG